MSHTYTPSAATVTAALTVTLPDDASDGVAVSTVNTPFQKLADYLETIRGALVTATTVLGVAFLKRIKVGGTAVGTGDFSLTRWGTTATKPAAGGFDMAGFISVTANGASIGANPIVSLGVKDGTMNSPIYIANCLDDQSPGVAYPVSAFVGVGSAIDFYVAVTPVAGRTYTIQYMGVKTA